MVAGLVLAAGAGARFRRDGGGIKQLADFRGRPLLQWAVDAQCAVSELERVVVVLGAHAEPIRASIEFGRAEPVVSDDWRHGISASLKTGVRALMGADTVIVTLGDQPLIDAELIRRFVGEPAGTRAVYDGRPGHPVVLGAAQLAAVETLTGDRGAAPLLRGGRLIECAGDAGAVDVDTVEDLRLLVRPLARPASIDQTRGRTAAHPSSQTPGSPR